MKKRYLLLIVLLIININTTVLLIININTTLYAAGTFTWKINDYQSFNKGKLIKTSLNEDGILALAPKFEKFTNMNAVFIWDIKEDSKGNIYFATGNEGIIYKLNKEDEISEFFQTSSIAAFKMLIDKKDNLYASTMTKGLIYKITPDGEGIVFAVFQEDYIWDMKFYKGNILIASGTPGCLYELDLKTKKITEIVLTKEMHIMCMDINDDNIYFGTSDTGAVYKLSEDAELSIIYQTGEKEIHSLVVDKKSGIIYAGTSDKEYAYVDYKREKKFEDEDKYEESLRKKIFDEVKEYKKMKAPLNAVYKIKENEYVNKVIESKDYTFLSLILDDKTLYIGSGDKGIIYIYKDNKIEKIAQLDEQQILTFYKLKNKNILFGTGNTGNVYQLSLQYAEIGIYLSRIFDSRGWASWGNIQWDEKKMEDTDITIQTRSGNTEDVDDTWSDWSEPYTDNEGAPITSPYGRFFQFKINFSTENKKLTPQVYSVKIPYLIKNRKPEVLSIKFLKKESSTKSINSTKKTSTYRKYDLKAFELKVQWETKDEDKDKLIYEFYTKLRYEDGWLLLKDKLNIKYYNFDTRVLPDGIYLFKVVADDLPSNSQSTRLKAEMISRPFIIDNTPPKIELEYENKDSDEYKITGIAKDNLSHIVRLSYSIDTKNWTSIFPVDKIFDSKTEKFQFNYKYEKGIIIIKVEDESGNIATSYIRITR